MHEYIICCARPNGGDLHLESTGLNGAMMSKTELDEREPKIMHYIELLYIHINLCVHVFKTCNARANMQVSAKKLPVHQ